MDDKTFLKMMQQLGVEIVADMAAILKLNGAIATGKLIDSIHSNVKAYGGGYTITISYLSYGKFVDEGRNPGSMPPIGAIRDWCGIKGIPKEAAYPIAMKIKEQGIKPVHFTKAFYDNIEMIKKALQGKYKVIVLGEIIKDIKKK